MKVLLADDDLDLLDLVSYALRKEGYDVVTARSGAQAVGRWETDPLDFAVVASALPKVSGFDVCRRIRSLGHAPIIVLVPRDDEEDILRAFRSGADDCIPKPLSVRQLGARMRRISWRYRLSPVEEASAVIRVADLELDAESHRASKAGRAIALTRLEFRLLTLLAQQAGRPVPYDVLIDHLWGAGQGEVALLRAHITHLRRKLGLGYGRRAGIRSIQSVGYALIP